MPFLRPSPARPNGFAKTPWQAWVLAPASTLATLFLCLALQTEHPALILFVIPILLSAYLGGLWPGLLASTLAGFFSYYLLLPPLQTFSLTKSPDALPWVVLLLIGILISILSEALHRSRRSAEASQTLHGITLASIGDAVITTDVEGRVTFLNPEAERLTGRSLEAVAGRPLTEVFQIRSERTGQVVDDPAGSIKRSGMTILLPTATVLLGQGGREIPIDAISAPIREQEGPLQGVVVVFRDCTKQRAAEAAVRERLGLEEKLSKFAATTPGVIHSFRLDPDGRATFPYANRKIEEIYGLSAQELARDAGPVQGLVHPEDHARVTAAIEESASRLTAFQEEMRILHPRRGELWIEIHSLPEREPGGATIWHGVIQEITARKRAESDLRSAQVRLQAALEAGGIGTWVCDLQRGTIAWDEALARLLGRGSGPQGLPLEQFFEFLHQDDRRRVQVALGRVAESGGDLDVQFRYGCPDGRFLWISARGRLQRDAEGRPWRLMGASVDLTSRIQLEEQYRQAQKMEAVGQLAGGVAHDFNNLLTVISGYSDLLLHRLAAGDPNRAILSSIRQAGERAAALTRQLLAFSRKQVMQPKKVLVNEVVAGTGRMLARLIGEDILLETQLSPAAGKVRVDPGQLEQVIINLAVNARDAMPKGGKLTIATGSQQLDEAACRQRPGSRPGRYAVLSITDTGCGMSPEVQARIFEPFFTTKGPGQGTGLGLATVFGIVRQSDGQIEVSSEPGRGTCFRIYLPEVDFTPSGARWEAVFVPPQRGSETILLVEDEVGVREIAKLSLEAHGYTVLDARNGREALQLFESAPGGISLLLTDVVMPELSGRQLAEQLQARAPGLKVLYISGYTDDAVIRHGVRSGQGGFLQKPFSPNTLAQAVRDILDGVSPEAG